MGRGAWWAAVHGVSQSRTQLKRLSMHALEREMATHSSILAWRIPGTKEPGGPLSMGSQKVGHDWNDLAAAAALVNHLQYWNQIDYILCSQRWRSSIQSVKTRPEADCGSDHEFLIAKFRLKLKKVGKTNSLFRYDLNQIPYDYTVKVRNRFKGLDLIDRVPEELWTEVCNIVQETGIETISKKKKWQKGKMVVCRGLTNSCEKKRSERQRRKGKIYLFECTFPKNSKER